jgi:glycosyltransferase involved in cell wall biosynthesis
MLDLTVVIPTYNRRQLLHDLVESLRSQSHPADRYEILIVSDGSTDGTDEIYATPLSSPTTRLVRQQKRGFGLSRARNFGLREARGRLILFIDDDMIADERLVETHVQAHAEPPEGVAVCGQVKLATDLPDTPFCRIVIGDICRLFKDTPEPEFLPFGLALSWQTSFKRTDLERLGGYAESFRSYGWEDIEFSYRADQEGLRFYYEPRAVSFHRDQRNTLSSHKERVRNASRMAPVLFEHHPALRTLLPMYADKGPINWRSDGAGLIWRKMLRRLLATGPLRGVVEGMTPIVERIFQDQPRLLRRWYAAVVGNYIVLGYREGIAQEITA